jgi:hypothetical protein
LILSAYVAVQGCSHFAASSKHCVSLLTGPLPDPAFGGGAFGSAGVELDTAATATKTAITMKLQSVRIAAMMPVLEPPRP